LKIYHSRREIKEIGFDALKSLHQRYVQVISVLLIIAAAISLLSIWEVLASYYTYTAPALVLILWPWIMQSAFMARLKKEQAAP
jgi:hypothetical protein